MCGGRSCPVTSTSRGASQADGNGKPLLSVFQMCFTDIRRLHSHLGLQARTVGSCSAQGQQQEDTEGSRQGKFVSRVCVPTPQLERGKQLQIHVDRCDTPVHTHSLAQCTLSHTLAHIHTVTHTCTYTCTHAHPHTCTPTCTHTLARMYSLHICMHSVQSLTEMP